MTKAAQAVICTCWFSNKANWGLPCYIKKKGNYRNVDKNIDEFQKL